MKPVYATEVTAESLLETAITSLMSTYNTIKDGGSGGPLTRAKAERILVQRMLSKNRRGRTGGAL